MVDIASSWEELQPQFKVMNCQSCAQAGKSGQLLAASINGLVQVPPTFIKTHGSTWEHYDWTSATNVVGEAVKGAPEYLKGSLGLLEVFLRSESSRWKEAERGQSVICPTCRNRSAIPD